MTSTAKAYGGKKHAGKLSYDPDAWATPQKLFEGLNQEFGFTLDVAAAFDNAKCRQYYWENGLGKDWTADAGNGTCFCNPPYSEVATWLEKAYQESQRGARVVCLVKSDTSTRWFREYYELADDVRFLPRIQFVPPPGYGRKVGSPNMGHALLIFGKFK